MLNHSGSTQDGICIIPLQNIPLVEEGQDLPRLLIDALESARLRPRDRDVLVVAHKIVSKVEGRMARAEDAVPSRAALELAGEINKDPHVVQLILDDSVHVVRQRTGVIITKHRKGWVCANAGLDYSNTPRGFYTRLPGDPDCSARMIRGKLEDHFGVRLAVIISDSHGRPFRLGVIGVALGISGLPGLLDRTGEPDLFGYRLRNTQTALADLIASAALLVMGEAGEGLPAAFVRGVAYESDEGSGQDLIRPDKLDLFK